MSITKSFAVLCCVLLLSGCGMETPAPVKKGPTYAEALTIYNQELALLDRLKQQASQAQALYEDKVVRQKASQALGEAVGGLTDLSAAGDLAKEALGEEEAAKHKEASE